mgnify:FL=1
MDNNYAPCTWCGHSACGLDTMHVEHACQECWDNQKQLDALKEANELRRETIQALNALMYDMYAIAEGPAQKPPPQKAPYVPYPKPVGRGVIVSEPRQRD